ncbi:MAG: HEAT repeat domain-containing protein [Planctomycetes bacterium]|nr:HEAT repeat domain-containing protein [Planctomycetota bacterium]
MLPQVASAQSGKLDQLTKNLRERTEARRAAASLAWKEQQASYLAGPNKERRENLAAFAPEIQGPILTTLRTDLAGEPIDPGRIDALVSLLDATVNSAGADRLAAELNRLPGAARLRAIDVLGQKGGPRSVRALEASLSNRDESLRDAALMALLRIGSAAQCRGWLERVDPIDQLSESQRLEILDLLTRRDLPAEFRLPTDWYELRETREYEALFAFLDKHPDETVEDFVIDYTFDRNRPMKLRLAGLAVAKHGAESFKWRDAKRRMGVLLRAKNGDPMANATAWTLHLLDDKAGARYLLNDPEEAVKRNKNDWRAHLELGEMQVRLSEFRDAFRSFENSIRLADISRGRLSSEDWLYAARAAAGARKEREAGEWLARTRMSPSELAPYRNLPEFSDLLDQEPFNRLFGSP